MALPPIGQQALRKGRVSEVGHLYFITKTARERVDANWSPEKQIAYGWLLQPRVPEIIMDSLDWLQSQGLISLWSYCLMPDHLHTLFQLGETTPLQDVMKRFGSFTGLKIARKTGRGAVWAKAITITPCVASL